MVSKQSESKLVIKEMQLACGESKLDKPEQAELHIRIPAMQDFNYQEKLRLEFGKNLPFSKGYPVFVLLDGQQCKELGRRLLEFGQECESQDFAKLNTRLRMLESANKQLRQQLSKYEPRDEES